MKPYLGICLVLLTLGGIAFFALRSCVGAVDHTVDEVRAAFDEVLHVQPQIKVDQRVVLTQTAPIAELAVVTKEELVTIGFDEHLEFWSMQIPLTEKILTAEAIFRLKAGFDLREPFSVTVDPKMNQVHATMPKAKILSVEQIGDITYRGQDAMLNRVTDNERAEILNKLNKAAHEAADRSGLRSDAEVQVAKRLNEIAAHNGQSFQIEWKVPPPPVNPQP